LGCTDIQRYRAAVGQHWIHLSGADGYYFRPSADRRPEPIVAIFPNYLLNPTSVSDLKLPNKKLANKETTIKNNTRRQFIKSLVAIGALATILTIGLLGASPRSVKMASSCPCPAGEHCEAGACVPDNSKRPIRDPRSGCPPCPAGEHCEGGACVQDK
jgi:hypothetical protein